MLLEITASQVATQLVDGFIHGLIYVAIAVGLTIIFGMLRFVNFAHGAFYTLGAFVALAASSKFGFLAGIIAAPITVALLAIVFEFGLLRRFYTKDVTAQILLTFGIAIVVEEALRLHYGGTQHPLPAPDFLTAAWNLGPLAYPSYRLVLAIFIIVMLVAVWLFIERTNFGLIVRAGVRDRTMVELLGGDVRRASTVILALGAGLAGLIGAAASPIYSVSPDIGSQFLVISFVVVVVGGLGSFWGAVAGGLLIGEVESLTVLFNPAASEVIIYIVMAIVLLVRPSGLLGESEVIEGARVAN